MSSKNQTRSYLNHNPTLKQNVYIDPAATVIGNVTLGEDTSVWPGAIIRGDVSSIRVGARTSVQDNAVLHVTHASDYNPDGNPLAIGDDVTIGHQACLHGCTIGDRVLIGIGAVVLDGAIVEDDVVIGAGALVPPGKRLESGHLYVGSPCRATRPLKEGELSFFTYSASHYVKLKNQYLHGE